MTGEPKVCRQTFIQSDKHTTIHNIQKADITQMPVNWRIAKKNAAHRYGRKLSSLEKKGDSCVLTVHGGDYVLNEISWQSPAHGNRRSPGTRDNRWGDII